MDDFNLDNLSKSVLRNYIKVEEDDNQKKN